MPKRKPSDPGYYGVVASRGVFDAIVVVGNEAHRGGRWPTAKQAAIASDRMVLWLGLDRPLNFPRQSKACGPCPAADLLREARTLRKVRAGGSRFMGVSRPGDGRTWRARTGPGLTVAGFTSEEEAAVAYDRVARHRGVQPSRLNFPERRLKPMSHEQLKAQMHKKRRAERGFVGVFRMRTGRFFASVQRDGVVLHAGSWSTEREAALARDRAALALGYPADRLNLPEQALAAGPMEAAALQRQARLTRRTERHTSQYQGVQWESDLGKWRAFITRDSKYTPIGVFDDEEDAAVARDRVWRHMGADPNLLNFPERRLKPASLNDMRKRVHETFKSSTSSQYTGVCHLKTTDRWLAYITVDGRRYRLGTFDGELEAAKAYDEAARRLGAKRARLNFG